LRQPVLIMLKKKDYERITKLTRANLLKFVDALRHGKTNKRNGNVHFMHAYDSVVLLVCL
jgi:hypothetical protein